ncbi:MAG: CCA tRNA nucleotidyltransferase [Rubellimicrobium sp.]|nr:CCA tRNA nucleotidyltransferase [Rubellimicrobium sp.]
MRILADWLHGPAATVVGILTAGGHQAWFVGGCVRNALIGGPVTDVDITTEAHPERVSDLARAAGLRVVPTGIDHGTVTVVADHQPFEVTTFRRDVETDGRRAVVSFARTMAEDAARRDFTMNALYATPDGAISDPLGGLEDALARHVRFIGDPGARIREDYLRILRFFRFHAWYGAPDQGIDAEGLAACAAHLDGLDRLSAERITAEVVKLLSAADPAPAVASMGASGVLWRILPGAAPDLLTVLVHVEGTAGLASDPMRRLAGLGGGTGRLRLSNPQAARLKRLADATPSDMGPGELGYRLGEGEALDVLALRAAGEGREIAASEVEQSRFGAGQTFPIRAADLMPGLQGPALGARLKLLEGRWIASGFALGRDQLLDTGA